MCDFEVAYIGCCWFASFRIAKWRMELSNWLTRTDSLRRERHCNFETKVYSFEYGYWNYPLVFSDWCLLIWYTRFLMATRNNSVYRVNSNISEVELHRSKARWGRIWSKVFTFWIWSDRFSPGSLISDDSKILQLAEGMCVCPGNESVSKSQ